MGQGTALAKMLPPSDVYLNSNDWCACHAAPAGAKPFWAAAVFCRAGLQRTCMLELELVLALLPWQPLPPLHVPCRPSLLASHSAASNPPPSHFPPAA